jgi:hypothetical protein
MGSVLVVVETSDGSPLPDGLSACLDETCQPLGAIAGRQVRALQLPSGSGVSFSNVDPGTATVSVRSAEHQVLAAQQTNVIAGEQTTVHLVIQATPLPPTATPTSGPTATPVPINSLPSTGSGSGKNASPVLLLIAIALLMLSGLGRYRRTGERNRIR